MRGREPFGGKGRPDEVFLWGEDNLFLNENGDPAVFHHGGGWDHRWRVGIWFSESKDVAASYRELGESKRSIQKCHIKSTRTKYYDFNGADWYGYKGSELTLIELGANGDLKLTDKLCEKAFKEGYDAVFFTNILDFGPIPVNGYEGNWLSNEVCVKSIDQVYWIH